jgi:hypothetical protein
MLETFKSILVNVYQIIDLHNIQTAAPDDALMWVFIIATAACGPARYAEPALNEYHPPQISAPPKTNIGKL